MVAQRQVEQLPDAAAGKAFADHYELAVAKIEFLRGDAHELPDSFKRGVALGLHDVRLELALLALADGHNLHREVQALSLAPGVERHAGDVDLLVDLDIVPAAGEQKQLHHRQQEDGNFFLHFSSSSQGRGVQRRAASS